MKEYDVVLQKELSELDFNIDNVQKFIKDNYLSKSEIKDTIQTSDSHLELAIRIYSAIED